MTRASPNRSEMTILVVAASILAGCTDQSHPNGWVSGGVVELSITPHWQVDNPGDWFDPSYQFLPGVPTTLDIPIPNRMRILFVRVEAEGKVRVQFGTVNPRTDRSPPHYHACADFMFGSAGWDTEERADLDCVVNTGAGVVARVTPDPQLGKYLGAVTVGYVPI